MSLTSLVRAHRVQDSSPCFGVPMTEAAYGPLPARVRVSFPHRASCSSCGLTDVVCRVSSWSPALFVCALCTSRGVA